MITLGHLQKGCPDTTASRLMLFVDPLNVAVEEFDISNDRRLAAFLAQLAHETGAFRYLKEIWGPTPEQLRYNERSDLGNTKAGAIAAAAKHGDNPGHFFMGHGGIQTTGYDNHCDVRDAIGVDCVETPTLLCEPIGAMRSAGYFWKRHNLNEKADAMKFSVISKGVNGVFREFRPGDLDRYGYYEAFSAAFGLTDAENVA